MSQPVVLIKRYGDAGLLVEIPDDDGEVRWRRAQAIADDLGRRRPAGIVDTVASFDTVFVAYDPLTTDHSTIADEVALSADTDTRSRQRRTFYLPVVYGGEFGPDLDSVAAEQGVSPDELVRLHCERPWVIRFRGAPASSPMFDGGQWPLPIAKAASPRPRVPAGSVAVSGLQSVIYSVPSPGGWRLIGRTPVQLVDARRPEIAPYSPGDLVRFIPAPADTWSRWVGPLHDLSDQLNLALRPG